MSIQLRDGFVDEPLERAMEDLLVRFVVNCPPEDLSSIERLFFQIEEAQWFYTDFLSQINPLLPPMSMKSFSQELLDRCPVVWKWGDRSSALNKFTNYKKKIPVRGVALLNEKMDKVALVKAVQGGPWGFPRGKISKDESDLDCAIREVREETGFDARPYINEADCYERTVRGKNCKIFFAKNVPETTDFKPEVRNEIAEVKWIAIKKLSKSTSKNSHMVNAFIAPLTQYASKHATRSSSSKSEEKLKRRAAIQIKKLLGVGESEEENKVIDAGRQLLDILHKVTDKPESADPAKQLLDILHSAQPQQQPQRQAQQQQQQLPQQIPPFQQMFPQFPPFPMASGGIPPFFLPMFRPPMFGHPGSNVPMMAPSFPGANWPIGMPPPMQFPVSQGNQGINAPTTDAQGEPENLAPAPNRLSRPSFDVIAHSRSREADSKELLSILTKHPEEPSKEEPSKAEDELPVEKEEKANGSSAASIYALGSPQQTQTDSADLLAALNKKKAQESDSIFNILKNPQPLKSAKDKGENEIMAVLNKSKAPETSSSNALLSILKKPKEEPKKSPAGDLLSVLNKPVKEKSPASDLLGMLKSSKEATEEPKKESPASNLLSVLNKPKEEPKEKSPASDLLSVLNKPKEESSSNGLLDLLKKPKQEPTEKRSSPSSDLLGILKKQPTEKAASSATDPISAVNEPSPSSSLLDVLKKPSEEKPQIPEPKSKPSNDLLNILKKLSAPETKKGGASDLLSMLNNKSAGTGPKVKILRREPEKTNGDYDSTASPEPTNAAASLKALLFKKSGTPSPPQPPLLPATEVVSPQGFLRGKKVKLLKRDDDLAASPTVAESDSGEEDTDVYYTAVEKQEETPEVSKPAVSASLYLSSDDEELEFEDFDELNGEY